MNAVDRVVRILSVVATVMALLLVSNTSQAAGTFKFCGRWAYSYLDQGFGEDYLLHSSGSTFGVMPAAYAYAEVERNNVVIWSGFMDSAGCTGTVTGSAGTYNLWTTTDMAVPSGPEILITPTSAQNWRWFQANWQLNAVTNPWTLSANFGPGYSDLAAAAAVERMLAVSDNGFMPQEYWIYSEETTGITHTSGNQVYLVSNPQFATWDAFFKSVVLHELGHAIQNTLFGTQAYDYTSGDSTAAICRCDHVYDPNDRAHCLQSREKGGTAQLEGFGQFVASVAQNRASDNDAWFPYYKNILYTDGQVYSPPISFSVEAWKWMENRSCTLANGGVELDWLGFYYWLHSRTADAYTFGDIGSVYRKACGNTMCSTTDTTWATLRTAAETLYGVSSSKAAYWRTQGDIYGVDW